MWKKLLKWVAEALLRAASDKIADKVSKKG